MQMHVVIDHFAGAGGWDLAARDLGVEAYGVENMREAVATRDRNGLTTLHSDVWDMDEHRIEADTFVSSPPCQAFSVAGAGKGRQALDEVTGVLWSDTVLHPAALKAEAERWGDERVGLVLTPITYALRYRPRFIALEQVPTVLPVWQAMAERLSTAGYYGWVGLLNAEQYGVPQTRKRAVLIARQSGGPPHQPTPTHSRYYPRDPARLDDGVLPWVSMGTALGRDPDEYLRSNYGTGGDPAARGERDAHEPAPTVTSKIDRNHWMWRRPSTTIVGSFKPEIVAAPGYRTTVSRQNAPDSVRVTLQEAAILQSFSPDFVFEGARGKQFLQVGNACPPLLARAVLTELWKETP